MPPPDSAAMRQTLRGEGLVGATVEPTILASGHSMKLRVGGAATLCRTKAAPWALDADQLSSNQCTLFDAISGTASICGSRPPIAAAVTTSMDSLPRQTEPMVGISNGEHTHRHQSTPRDSLFGAVHTDSSVVQLPVPPRGCGLGSDVTLQHPPPAEGQELLDMIVSLASALADRQTTWSRAFAPYDHAGTGIVSLADTLRVFRAAGLSPQPTLLRSLPTTVLCEPQGVLYRELERLVPIPFGITQNLQSSTTAVMHSSRRPHLTPGVPQSPSSTSALPPVVVHDSMTSTFARNSAHGYELALLQASGGAQNHPAEQVSTPLAHPEAAATTATVTAESLTRRRRLFRLLTERSQALSRSPHELWAEMRPSAGGIATPRGLCEGLRRLGLDLGEDDFHELVCALASDDEHGPVIRWDAWQGFFAGGVPLWENSAAERRRRLTLNRLLGALQSALGRDIIRLVRWFAVRDIRRTGRVSIADFCSGLRANGVLIADADAGLAAVEVDPQGGGVTLDYTKLSSLMGEGRTSCPMPS